MDYKRSTRFNKRLYGEHKDFILWTLKFTKIIVVIITILFILDRIFDAVSIGYAMYNFQNFSYLDTYITDNGETFRQIVGMYIITKTVENVFKYNDGGFFGTSISETQCKPEDKEFG